MLDKERNDWYTKQIDDQASEEPPSVSKEPEAPKPKKQFDLFDESSSDDEQNQVQQTIEK